MKLFGTWIVYFCAMFIWFIITYDRCKSLEKKTYSGIITDKQIIHHGEGEVTHTDYIFYLDGQKIKVNSNTFESYNLEQRVKITFAIDGETILKTSVIENKNPKNSSIKEAIINNTNNKTKTFTETDVISFSEIELMKKANSFFTPNRIIKRIYWSVGIAWFVAFLVRLLILTLNI